MNYKYIVKKTKVSGNFMPETLNNSYSKLDSKLENFCSNSIEILAQILVLARTRLSETRSLLELENVRDNTTFSRVFLIL